MSDSIGRFREDNQEQLQLNLDKLVAIRDQPSDLRVKCPHCKKMHSIDVSSAARDKNRIESAKGIARHLGALQPDRTGSGATDPTSPLDKELSTEEQASLDEFLKGHSVEKEPEMVS